jgi:hypothetical protein
MKRGWFAGLIQTVRIWAADQSASLRTLIGRNPASPTLRSAVRLGQIALVTVVLGLGLLGPQESWFSETFTQAHKG